MLNFPTRSTHQRRNPMAIPRVTSTRSSAILGNRGDVPPVIQDRGSAPSHSELTIPSPRPSLSPEQVSSLRTAATRAARQATAETQWRPTYVWDVSQAAVFPPSLNHEVPPQTSASNDDAYDFPPPRERSAVRIEIGYGPVAPSPPVLNLAATTHSIPHSAMAVGVPGLLEPLSLTIVDGVAADTYPSNPDSPVTPTEVTRFRLGGGTTPAAPLHEVLASRPVPDESQESGPSLGSPTPHLDGQRLAAFEGFVHPGTSVIVVDHTVEASLSEDAETRSSSSEPQRETGECLGDAAGNNRQCVHPWNIYGIRANTRLLLRAVERRMAVLLLSACDVITRSTVRRRPQERTSQDKPNWVVQSVRDRERLNEDLGPVLM
ncbi:unnamed protein product [Cutaneotrichosporon oleaginosum]